MSYSPYGRTAAQQFVQASLSPSTEHRDRHEPTETKDPVNGLLDLFEAQVRLLLDNGAEVALRTRLGRLLPSLLLVASDTPSASRPEATGSPSHADDTHSAAPSLAAGSAQAESPATSRTETELQLVALISDCARFEKFKMSAAAHACVGRIKAAAAAELAAVKRERTAQ